MRRPGLPLWLAPVLDSHRGDDVLRDAADLRGADGAAGPASWTLVAPPRADPDPAPGDRLACPQPAAAGPAGSDLVRLLLCRALRLARHRPGPGRSLGVLRSPQHGAAVAIAPRGFQPRRLLGWGGCSVFPHRRSLQAR